MTHPIADATPRAQVPGWRIRLLLSVQVAALLVAAFVPFGFDHPSSLGLDFGHFLLLGVVYLGAWLGGLVLAVRARQWGAFAAQIALLACFAAHFLWGALDARSAGGGPTEPFEVRRG